MAITDRATAAEMFVSGKSYFTPFDVISAGTTTAAAANSGHISFPLEPNAIGTTLPGTLQSIPKSTSTDPVRIFNLIQSTTAAASPAPIIFAWIYLIGTQVLSSTGDQFTHNAATFPLTRTWLGQTTNIPLTPLIQVTTATATTAPIIRLRTNAGGAGYTNQAGNSIVGTETLTFPNATTANNSTYQLPLELTDSSILDITAIETTTAGSAGAASVWGMEYISPMGVPSALLCFAHDSLTAGLTMSSLQPAAPTSGSLTSHLVAIRTTNSGVKYSGFISGIVDV